jgi:hypothetical protein
MKPASAQRQFLERVIGLSFFFIGGTENSVVNAMR